jgi:hypothetical protein
MSLASIVERLARWGGRFRRIRFSILVAMAVCGPALAELPDPFRFAMAVEAGNLEQIESWFAEGLDPDFVGERIGTGLMIAAWQGDLAMLELFRSKGADINRTNANGEQALMLAAWNGHAEAVRWLLDHGARVNRGRQDWSALHYAVFSGNEPITRMLLELGADVNAQAPNGSSVLMMAAREGREALAGMLLDWGADPRLTNDRGEDALVWSMRHGNYRIAKLVSDPERFGEAARQPAEQFGAPVRSLPAPQRMDALMRQMRIAEAEGRPIDELRQAYIDALEELYPTPAEAELPPGAPAALEITAERGTPGREKAQLIYDRGAYGTPPEPTATKPKASTPAANKRASSTPNRTSQSKGQASKK